MLGAGTISVISFDVSLQAFHDGDAAPVDAARVLEGLARFSIEPVTADSSWIRTIDSEVQIFGLHDAANGFMINHASGRVIWDALIDVAELTGMTILPISGPACVTRAELLDQLPEVMSSLRRHFMANGASVRAIAPFSYGPESRDQRPARAEVGWARSNPGLRFRTHGSADARERPLKASGAALDVVAQPKVQRTPIATDTWPALAQSDLTRSSWSGSGARVRESGLDFR
jgi:hypothetical protein